MKICTRILSASIVSMLTLSTAFAAHDFTPTSAGTFDSNANGNWNNGVPSGDGQDVNFQQSISSGDQTVTNLFKNGGGSFLNYLRLATGGSSLLSVVTQNGTGIDSQFGLELRARDTLILNGGNSTLSHGNNSFDNRDGTLVVSNGASVWVNIGGNAVQNQGTITLDSGSGQTSVFNYNLSTGGAINNSGTGTMIKNGAGSGTFSGAGNNISFVNNGTMIVNGGTMVVNSDGAFNDDGFNNTSSGRIFVNSGATFAVDRNANAWNNDSEPDNDGRIFLNGGTLTVLFGGSQASDRGIQNNGTISGSGTLALKILQSSTGNTIASNGTLNVFQTVAGNQQTFTSVGGQFGTFKAVNGGTLQFNGTVVTGMGGAWTINQGGTFDINSQSVDLGTTFMPGSNIKGTIRVTTGGNFTFASTVAGGGYQDNQGTLDLQGGSVFMPNDSANAVSGEFTNSTTGTIIGNGLVKTGFGGGGAPDYGIMNKGVITATNGTLTLRPEDAFSLGGVQNAAGGLMTIKNDATLTFTRTSNAWFNSNVAVTNSGGINLQGGVATLRGSNTALNVQANRIVNASGGTITGSGTILGFVTVENNGFLTANTGDFTVDSLGNGFLVNNSGGVISNQAVTFTASSSVGSTGINVTNSGIIVNTGTFIVDTSGLISGTGGITNTSRVIINSAGTNTYAGVISGTGSLTKNTSSGKLILSGVSTYTGTTLVNAGTLAVNGSIGNSAVTVASGAMLQGSGTVGSISGAGRVGPGNSPGILTASQVDPSAGTDYAYEFTQTGDPTWSTATASGNDVLRLTHATSPFTANLSLANVEDVFLDLATVTSGNVFRGGFYTDKNGDFTTAVSGASYLYYVLGDGNGLAATFNGQGYYSLAGYNPALSIAMSVVQVPSANFSGGTILNGWVQQFSVSEAVSVVPEPSMVLLLLTGLGTMYAARRRRNRKH